MAEDNELRAALWNGGLYVIRDVMKGGKFSRCEYAAIVRDGELVWRPCIEGVQFADIEPLGVEY